MGVKAWSEIFKALTWVVGIYIFPTMDETLFCVFKLMKKSYQQGGKKKEFELFYHCVTVFISFC